MLSNSCVSPESRRECPGEAPRGRGTRTTRRLAGGDVRGGRRGPVAGPGQGELLPPRSRVVGDRHAEQVRPSGDGVRPRPARRPTGGWRWSRRRRPSSGRAPRPWAIRSRPGRRGGSPAGGRRPGRSGASSPSPRTCERHPPRPRSPRRRRSAPGRDASRPSSARGARPAPAPRPADATGRASPIRRTRARGGWRRRTRRPPVDPRAGRTRWPRWPSPSPWPRGRRDACWRWCRSGSRPGCRSASPRFRPAAWRRNGRANARASRVRASALSRRRNQLSRRLRRVSRGGDGERNISELKGTSPRVVRRIRWNRIGAATASAPRM